MFTNVVQTDLLKRPLLKYFGNTHFAFHTFQKGSVEKDFGLELWIK